MIVHPSTKIWLVNQHQRKNTLHGEHFTKTNTHFLVGGFKYFLYIHPDSGGFMIQSDLRMLFIHGLVKNQQLDNS